MKKLCNSTQLLIPYRWLWITSPLSEEEVKRRISAHVDLKSPCDSFAIYDHKYGGSVTREGFMLKRKWRTRTTINIRAEWDEAGSRVGVKINTPVFVGFLAILPLAAAELTIEQGYRAAIAAAAVGALMCSTYWFEQRTLLRDLDRMLAGEPSL
ncbi:MAG TPA: hypothetical protein VKT81_26185 [Bryobacteraceae bacterium]|nr:hypothetical protein [Bryobacteraceae bacterium]